MLVTNILILSIYLSIYLSLYIGKGTEGYAKQLLTALDSLLILPDDNGDDHGITCGKKKRIELDEYGLGYVTKKDALSVQAYRKECGRRTGDGNPKTTANTTTTNSTTTNSIDINNSIPNTNTVNNNNSNNKITANTSTESTTTTSSTTPTPMKSDPFDLMTAQDGYCGLLSELVRLLGTMLNCSDGNGDFLCVPRYNMRTLSSSYHKNFKKSASKTRRS